MKRIKGIATVLLSAIMLFTYMPVMAFAADDDIASGVYDGVSWRITSDYELVLGLDGETQQYSYIESRTSNGQVYPWHSYCESILSVRFDGIVVGNGDMSHMFYYFTKAKTFDLTNFDTSNITNMSYMFGQCWAVKSLDLSGFDTSKVTDMSFMFVDSYCIKSLDVSSFDTSNVTDMSFMFSNIGVETLDVSNFDTSNVINMYDMFANCQWLQSIDLSIFDTSKVTNMGSMFDGCKKLTSLDLHNFDTSNVTSLSRMFAFCNSLTDIDISSFDTSNVTSMSYLFHYCDCLTDIDISNFDTSNVKNMSYMFFGVKAAETFDLSNLNTKKVTNMSYMFSGCESLNNLDLSMFDTSAVTSMEGMFENCTAITDLDLSSFDTSNVTTMECMFYGCKSLNNVDVHTFNTYKVLRMPWMFKDCYALTSLDLSSFDTLNVMSISEMIAGCVSLKLLKVGDYWDYTNVTARYGGPPEFPVEMYDKETGEVYEKGTDIPGTINRTYVSADEYVDDPGDDPDTSQIVRKYIIGQDTWKFINNESGPISYGDYLKMFDPFNALIFYKACPSYGGLCYGYSLVIPSVIENGWPFYKGEYDIHDYEFTDVKDYLILGHIYQKTSAASSELESHQGNLNELYEAVCEEMYNGGDPVCISFLGHMTLAASIYKDTPEEVIIGVYDCNFPDNIYPYDDINSLYNETVYPSIRLYGEDGKYTRCEYELSKIEGGEYVWHRDVTESVSFISDIDTFSRRMISGTTEYSGEPEYALIFLPVGTLVPKGKTIEVNNFEGENEDSNNHLYWVENTDGEFHVTNVKANNEICISLGDKCIFITSDKDSDIDINFSEDSEYAEISVISDNNSNVKCKYMETESVDDVIQTELSLAGDGNISVKISNDEIISNGATELSAEQISGSLDSDDAELIGETVFNNSYDQLDPDSEYNVSIIKEETTDDPEADPCAAGHTYGDWSVTKAATELAAGKKTRTCSVCGATETQTIAKLSPTLKKVAISKVTAGKKSAAVKWKKLTKGNLKKIKKIQIQYSTDKTFKTGVKNKYVSAKKTSLKIKGLKSKKKYYVRIRAYTKSGSTVHISKWSSKKSFKAK